MTAFEGVTVTLSPELQRLLDGHSVLDSITRNAPRAMTVLLGPLRSAAPRGKTGKLARGFDLSVRQRSGFLGGLVEVAIGARVPYGHLVESGHRIIPRGATRFTVAARALKGNARLRGRERTALKARRASFGGGAVPGQHFAERVFQAGRPQVVALLERLIGFDLSHV